MWVDAFKKLEETMHVHTYIKDIFLKTPLLIYFNIFPNFFAKFKLPNSGEAYL